MDEQDDRLPLYRRKVFDSDLLKYVAESRAENPVALVMVDLDKFKAVNDTHGHPIGDELLIEVARCANAVVGSKGRAYRYGGEEVAILLPNYSSEEALALAERLRRTLEAGTWTSRQLKVTASFGVAVAPALASNAPDLLRLADAALYEAKHVGRNYVRLAGEPPPAASQPRQPDRREPPPGGVSETQMEELRLQYYKRGVAHCPTDGAPLKVEETTGFGFTRPGLDMACPVCGFEVRIPGIPVAKQER
jgi:diguanylate cyclase (GGDEF)-like protein